MSARLASGVWVSGYLTRLRLADIPAYVTAKGDPQAGAVVVKVALLDGTARILLAEGAETDVDVLVARTRSRDPDLWVIELEDRAGRTLLDQDGLSD